MKGFEQLSIQHRIRARVDRVQALTEIMRVRKGQHNHSLGSDHSRGSACSTVFHLDEGLSSCRTPREASDCNVFHLRRN